MRTYAELYTCGHMQKQGKTEVTWYLLPSGATHPQPPCNKVVAQAGQIPKTKIWTEELALPMSSQNKPCAFWTGKIKKCFCFVKSCE